LWVFVFVLFLFLVSMFLVSVWQILTHSAMATLVFHFECIYF
jgi:hypothetical protein